MLDKPDLDKIKKTTRELFEKMGFEVELEFLPEEDQTLPIKVQMEEPEVLIGKQGRTLAKIQKLLGAILKREIEQEFYLNLDINDYKKQKRQFLKQLAQKTADQVSLSKEQQILRPMPAYERRIIHLELGDREDVTTESVGQEPHRKVVVRPYP